MAEPLTGPRSNCCLNCGRPRTGPFCSSCGQRAVPVTRRISRGPFTTTLRRIPGKGGWTYVRVPKKLTPPITRAWARTPVRASIDGVEWDTSVWRSKTGAGFLPVPKRIRGDKAEGARVTIAFSFEDD